MTPDAADPPLLAARDVTKAYRLGERDLEVLAGVSLDIAQGEIVSICGPSGAGKSTLLHILGALDTPSTGEVLLRGEPISGLSDRRKARLRNRTFGFVFQFFHLLPDFSALENVGMPCVLDPRSEHRAGAKRAAQDVLERVGLADRQRHRPDQLSGGERQRVAIARALVNEPEVLLCDEPTGNLDSKTSADILELIVSLNETLGLTVVLVTHDDVVAKQTPRLVRLADGLVVADGTRAPTPLSTLRAP